MIIQFTSVFDKLDNDELAELKVHIADWMTEASFAYRVHAQPQPLYSMMHEFADIYREVRRIQAYRRAFGKLAGAVAA